MGGELDIFFEQGGDWRPVWQWQDDNGVPVDLTGYTAALQVRPSYDSDDVLLDLASDGDAPTITLTRDGRIQPVALAAVTGAFGIDESKGRYSNGDTRPTFRFGVWDLLLTSSIGEETKLLSGNAFIIPGVTRAR